MFVRCFIDLFFCFLFWPSTRRAGVAQTGPSGDLRRRRHRAPDVAAPSSLTRELDVNTGPWSKKSSASRRRRAHQRVRAFDHRCGRAGGYSGYSPDLNNAQKLQLLETLDIVERLTLSLQFQQERLAELRVRKRIREDVKPARRSSSGNISAPPDGRHQKELGENEGSIAEEYQRRSRRPACPRRCSSRPSASSRDSSGWAIRTPSRP